MTRIRVNGSIVNDADAGLYRWFGIPCASPADFRQQLEAAEGDVIVEINSPGGYIAPAAEIYEAIRTYPGSIECRVVGQAASAASVIACAAKNSISPMGTFFIHNCITTVVGNHNDMRQAMRTTESVDESIMEAYRAKTGMSDDDIYALMEENTTLNARQAVEYGFIDEITESAADIAQASSAVTGIAASAGGFVDLMAMDADRLAAVREAYENSLRADGEGGETMLRDETFAEETEETAEAQTDEAEANDACDEEADAPAATEEPEGEPAEEVASYDGEPEEPEADAQGAQAAYDRGVMAERARIAGILDIAAQVPDTMLRAALFEQPISAEALALQAMRADGAARAGYMEQARADVAASNSADVAADVSDFDAADGSQALIAKMKERF